MHSVLGKTMGGQMRMLETVLDERDGRREQGVAEQK
jgi:hypothetical protein